MLFLLSHYYYDYKLAAVKLSVRYNRQCCSLPVVAFSVHVSSRRAFIALIRYNVPDPAVPVMMTCSGSGGGGLHYLMLHDEKQGCCKRASVVYWSCWIKSLLLSSVRNTWASFLRFVIQLADSRSRAGGIALAVSIQLNCKFSWDWLPCEIVSSYRWLRRYSSIHSWFSLTLWQILIVIITVVIFIDMSIIATCLFKLDR